MKRLPIFLIIAALLLVGCRGFSTQQCLDVKERAVQNITDAYSNKALYEDYVAASNELIDGLEEKFENLNAAKMKELAIPIQEFDEVQVLPSADCSKDTDAYSLYDQAADKAFELSGDYLNAMQYHNRLDNLLIAMGRLDSLTLEQFTEMIGNLPAPSQ